MRKSTFGAVALGAVALGCGGAPPASSIFTTVPVEAELSAAPEVVTPEQTTARAREQVSGALQGVADASAQIDEGESISMVTEALEPPPCPTDPNVPLEEDDFEVTEGLEQAIRDFNTFLLDKVLLDQFAEAADGQTVIYRLDPATVCEGDVECVDRLTATPVKLRVQSSDEKLHIEVLVGTSETRGGIIVVGDGLMAVEGNLADLKLILQEWLAANPSADGTSAKVPETMEGVIAASLVRNAAGDFTLSWGIQEAVHVRADAGEQEFVEVRYAAAPDALNLHIDGVAHELSAGMNYGSIDASAAGSLFCASEASTCGDKERTGTFAYHMGGLTGATTLRPGDQALSFTELGFGDTTTTASLNSESLGSLDVNANSGRRFSLNVEAVAAGTLITFTPELDLRLAIMLSTLSESLRVDMPTWLSNEVFNVTLTGESSASVLVPTPACAADGTRTAASQVRVETGTLTASATSATAPIQASAGMCIGQKAEVVEDAHVFDRIEAQTCAF